MISPMIKRPPIFQDSEPHPLYCINFSIYGKGRVCIFELAATESFGKAGANALDGKRDEQH